MINWLKVLFSRSTNDADESHLSVIDHFIRDGHDCVVYLADWGNGDGYSVGIRIDGEDVEYLSHSGDLTFSTPNSMLDNCLFDSAEDAKELLSKAQVKLRKWADIRTHVEVKRARAERIAAKMNHPLDD